MCLLQKQHNMKTAVILTIYHGLLSQNTLSLFELYSKQYYRQYTLMLPKNENRWLIMIFNQLSHKSSLIFTIEVWAYEEYNLKLIIVIIFHPIFDENKTLIWVLIPYPSLYSIIMILISLLCKGDNRISHVHGNNS